MRERITDEDITMIVQELCFDSSVIIDVGSRSTAYRTRNRVNEYLRREDYNWRVRLIIRDDRFPYVLESEAIND